MKKFEALLEKVESLTRQVKAGNLVLPRGSRLVITMPEDKLVATLVHTGEDQDPVVVLGGF